MLDMVFFVCAAKWSNINIWSCWRLYFLLKLGIEGFEFYTSWFSQLNYLLAISVTIYTQPFQYKHSNCIYEHNIFRYQKERLISSSVILLFRKKFWGPPINYEKIWLNFYLKNELGQVLWIQRRTGQTRLFILGLPYSIELHLRKRKRTYCCINQYLVVQLVCKLTKIKAIYVIWYTKFDMRFIHIYKYIRAHTRIWS